ncbi:hypothetical protein Tco_0146999, partial [Tanacetum coccineum]
MRRCPKKSKKEQQLRSSMQDEDLERTKKFGSEKCFATTVAGGNSLIGFFLGLQLKQKEDEIFISQDKYMIEILKKFGFTDVKTISTPMETQKLLLKDED